MELTQTFSRNSWIAVVVSLCASFLTRISSPHRLFFVNGFESVPVVETTISVWSGIVLYYSAKIVVHLQKPVSGTPPGPVASSRYNFVRLSFRDSGQSEVKYAMLSWFYPLLTKFESTKTHTVSGMSCLMMWSVDWMSARVSFITLSNKFHKILH